MNVGLKFSAFVFFLLFCAFTSSFGMAQTWTIDVTTREDQLDLPGLANQNPDNGCSLREAIETANALMGFADATQIPACELDRGGALNPTAIRILLSIEGAYEIGANFTEVDVELNNARGDFYLYAGLDVVIEKSPRVIGEVIIDGFQRDRLFRIEGSANSTVTFRNLVFQNGRPIPHNELSINGGAITSRNIAELHIEGCQFIDNQTSPALLEDGTYDVGFGGAIFSRRGSIYLNESVFIQNQTSPIEVIPQNRVVSRGYGGALYFLNARQIVIESSSFIDNVSDFSGTLFFDYAANESPIQPAIIQHCQFIRNTTFSNFPLFRLRKGVEIVGNLFFENASVRGILEIGELAANDIQSKVQANVFVANRGRNLISPFLNNTRLPIQFNSFFQNESAILNKRADGTTSLFGNLIAGFGNASTVICRWDGAGPAGNVISSQGFNIFWRGNYNCGESHPNDMILDENTEETWEEIIELPSDQDPDWDGTIELTAQSIARDAIPFDESLCQNAGSDFLDHQRPESEGGLCDIGALEMENDLPPDPEEGAGGMGGMNVGDGAGGETLGGNAGEPSIEPPPMGGEQQMQGGMGGEPENSSGGSAGEPVIVGPIAGESAAGGIGEETGSQNIGGEGETGGVFVEPVGGEPGNVSGGSAGEPFIEPPPMGGEQQIQGGIDSEPQPLGGEDEAGGIIIAHQGGMGGERVEGIADEPDLMGPIAGEIEAGGFEEGLGGQNSGGQTESGGESAGGQDETPQAGQGGSGDDDLDSPRGNGKKASGCQCSVKGFTATSTPNHFWVVAGLFSALGWWRKRARLRIKQ